MIDDIHQQFIEVVKSGRGDKLVEDDKLFSGLIWTGDEAIQLGLVDGLASASQVARDIVGAEDIVDFTRHENFLDSIAKQMGASFAGAISEWSLF